MRKFYHLLDRYNESEENTNRRAASLICAIYNSNLEKFERDKPFTVSELLDEKDEENMQDVAELWSAVMGGDINCLK